LNRYSSAPIVIADPGPDGKQLFGVLRLDDPEGFDRTAAVTLSVSASY